MSKQSTGIQKPRTLTKRELVESIARQTDLLQGDVYNVVQKTLDGIIDALEEKRNVEFREFGVFELVKRKSRIGRNPNQPENEVLIPDRLAVKFKPGKRLREFLAKPL